MNFPKLSLKHNSKTNPYTTGPRPVCIHTEGPTLYLYCGSKVVTLVTIKAAPSRNLTKKFPVFGSRKWREKEEKHACG